MMYRRVMRVMDAKGMREDMPKKKRKKSKKKSKEQPRIVVASGAMPHLWDLKMTD